MAGIFDKRVEDPTYNPYTDIGSLLASGITQTPEEKRKRLDQLTADIVNGQKPGALGILADRIIKMAGNPSGAAGIYSEGGGMMPDRLPTKQSVINRGVANNMPNTPNTSATRSGIVPVNTNRMITPETQAQAPARHPAEGFADVYAYAESLSPDKFKRFVDRNQDKEGFSGFGYIEAKDPKTGKMRIEKVIDRPSNNGGGMGGIDLSKATVGDLEAIGPILNAMEARKDNALYRQGLLETRKDEAATRKSMADEALSSKKAISFQNRLDITSPTVGVDEAGKPVKARDVGLLDMMDSGMKFRDDVPDIYPAAENLWNTRERDIVSQFKAKGIPYNPSDINKPNTPTFKNREILKKMYRDAMIAKNTPKF